MPLDSATVITNACQIARCPQYLQQAGNKLNAILQDLCMNNDFEIARKVYNFTFNSSFGNQSGPYALPANWLRAKDQDVFYTILGVPYPMVKVELEQYDWFIQQAGLNSFPTFYTTDMSLTPPAMFVWVPPSGSYPVTARYYSLMPDIASPNIAGTIPWFPFTNYLETRLAGELMKYTDDERVGMYLSSADPQGNNGFEGAGYLLNRYLKMKDDRDDIVDTVRLDRRRFGPGSRFQQLPNTKTVGWTILLSLALGGFLCQYLTKFIL